MRYDSAERGRRSTQEPQDEVRANVPGQGEGADSGWLLDGAKRAWVLLAVVVVLAHAVLTLTLGQGDKLTAYSNVSLFLIILIAAGVSGSNAIRGFRGYRPFWILFSLSMATWALDQWLWIYYEFWLHTAVPNESIGDPALFLHTVPLMGALAVRPHLEPSGRRLHQTTFSFLLLLFFWVFLYGYYVFPHQYLIPDPSRYWLQYNALYFSENLAVIVLAGLLVLRSAGPWKLVYLTLFGASALYAIISEQINVAINTVGASYSIGVYDWGITAATCLFALAAIWGGSIPATASQPRQFSPRLARYVTLLSILAVILVPLLGVRVLYHPDTPQYLQQLHLLTILVFGVIFTALVCLQLYTVNADLQREISVRVEVERGLREAKVAAEAGNRAKSEFLANMSHEIRTPMNGVIGMTELALATPLNREQREYLTVVKDAGNALLALLNDILDLSKIEAGKLSLDPTDFNLAEMLATSLRSIALAASKKGVEIIWRTLPGVPEFVLGDAGRLRQVIVNLVGNAIKFTEQGEVAVTVSVENRLEADGVLLHFEVRDTGIGIPSEKQQVIFDAFTQADSSMTRKFGGTGLGLTISSRLVQIMGGEIWVESSPGKGSTFHFTAQVKHGALPGVRPSTLETLSLRGMAALVVDDSVTNRECMGSTLKRWSMAVELAAGGEEAIAALRRAEESGSPFPLIFIDAEMPNMDGFELVQKIHQNPLLAAATLIMMLTHSGQIGDAARCRELGISTHLVKPVGESELFQAIQTALAKPPHKPREAPFAPPPPLPSPKPKRILLAEDNAVNRQVVIRLLEKRGHVITVATDGAQAVAMTRKSSFDLVLMDIQMPGMDGYEATAVIRKDEESTGKHLPIIAMTAHAMEGDRQKCLAAGMDDFVAKPIRVDELVKIIENHDRTPQEAAEPEANGNSGQTAIDLNLALARVGGDTDLLKEIAGLFCNQAPESMATIKRAMNAHDAVTIQRETHRLKGSIGNFASQAAFDAAQRLESLGTEGNFSEAVNAYALLENEIDRLLSALAALKDLEAGT